MTLTLITGPATEPVDRVDAKLHLRISGIEEDILIDGLIAAARLSIEAHAGVALISQTWISFPSQKTQGRFIVSR